MKSLLAFSGGKDSTAMLYGLKDRGIVPDVIVFADTLMEFPEMYSFMDQIEKDIGKEITKLKPYNDWDTWFYKKISRGKEEGRMHGFPYIITPCWYQREAKARPLDAFFKDNQFDLVYVGLNNDERHRMMDEKRFNYPLIDWGMGTREVIRYCKKIGKYNPLYDRFTRLGCWLCPKQSDKSLYSLWKYYPELWVKLLKYEQDSPHGFKIKTLSEYEVKFKELSKQTKLFDLEDTSYCMKGDCQSNFGMKTDRLCGVKRW